MLEAGIIDPTKVTRVAPRYRTIVSCGFRFQIISSEYLIYNIITTRKDSCGSGVFLLISSI